MSPSTLRSPPYSLRDLHHTLGLGVSQIPQEKPSKIAQNHISTISYQGPHAQRGLKSSRSAWVKNPHFGQKWARAQRGLYMPRSARTLQAPRFQNFTCAQRDPFSHAQRECTGNTSFRNLVALSVDQICHAQRGPNFCTSRPKLSRAQRDLKAHTQCED